MGINKYTNIAIADDHPIVRKAICDYLSNFDFKIIAEGNNGKELIESIENADELPNICLLDISMPIMDGYETIKVLQQRWPSIKTMIFSMSWDEYCIVKMISYGAKGYLGKNSHPSELRKALYEMNEFGFYYSEAENNILSDENDVDSLKKYNFSDRELQFIKFCCSELTYKEIASEMNTSLHTIDKYRDALFLKLKLKSRVGIVMFAIRARLIHI